MELWDSVPLGLVKAHRGPHALIATVITTRPTWDTGTKIEERRLKRVKFNSIGTNMQQYKHLGKNVITCKELKQLIEYQNILCLSLNVKIFSGWLFQCEKLLFFSVLYQCKFWSTVVGRPKQALGFSIAILIDWENKIMVSGSSPPYLQLGKRRHYFSVYLG